MSHNYQNLLTREQQKLAGELIASLSAEQLQWLGGFITGVNEYNEFLKTAIAEKLGVATQKTNGTEVNGKSVNGTAPKLKILYGSHSGNAKKVADLSAQLAANYGLEVSQEDMADYNPRKLKQEKNLLMVVSTHGEGVPPVAAADLHKFLHGKKASKLEETRFAVIGLGDSSYRYFCKTGSDFYHRLEALGGKPVYQPVSLDVDFNEVAGVVLENILPLFAGDVSNPDKNFGWKMLVENKPETDQLTKVEVLERVNLNGRGSKKETYHLELSLEDTGLTYLPGDALEVYASNPPKLVGEILTKLNIDPQENVGEKGLPVQEALEHHFEITVVTFQVLKQYAELAQNEALNQLIGNEEQLKEFLYGTDFLDLLNAYPVELTAGQLVKLLRKLPPRLYSISSSLEACPEEVHITVGAVRYDKNEREHEGVCSTYLADRLGEEQKLSVKIKSNEGFRLPENNDAPLVMVGPGTGIAPFRSFIQERDATGAKGKNWLFYGDQHFETDFLYQAEWLKYREKGVLTNLDVAFSRDQEEKVYVQHKMKQNGTELFKWIEQGAYIYVCGDMHRMAKDVNDILFDIIKKEGKFSKKEAAKYLNQLKKNGRYREDVY